MKVAWFHKFGGPEVLIGEEFPLAQAAEAHRVVDSRDFFGKVVLVP